MGNENSLEDILPKSKIENNNVKFNNLGDDLESEYMQLYGNLIYKDNVNLLMKGVKNIDFPLTYPGKYFENKIRLLVSKVNEYVEKSNIIHEKLNKHIVETEETKNNYEEKLGLLEKKNVELNEKIDKYIVEIEELKNNYEEKNNVFEEKNEELNKKIRNLEYDNNNNSEKIKNLEKYVEMLKKSNENMIYLIKEMQEEIKNKYEMQDKILKIYEKLDNIEKISEETKDKTKLSLFEGY